MLEQAAALPLYEPGALDELTADTDLEFRQIALKQFASDLQGFMAGLMSADMKERKRLIHTMGSSCALMGAVRLQVACHGLEPECETLDAAQLRALVELARETAVLYAKLI